LASWSRYDVMG